MRRIFGKKKKGNAHSNADRRHESLQHDRNKSQQKSTEQFWAVLIYSVAFFVFSQNDDNQTSWKILILIFRHQTRKSILLFPVGFSFFRYLASCKGYIQNLESGLAPPLSSSFASINYFMMYWHVQFILDLFIYLSSVLFLSILVCEN